MLRCSANRLCRALMTRRSRWLYCHHRICLEGTQVYVTEWWYSTKLTPINTIAIRSHLSNTQLTHRTNYTFPDSVDTSWCNWLMSSRILCNTQNPSLALYVCDNAYVSWVWVRDWGGGGGGGGGVVLHVLCGEANDNRKLWLSCLLVDLTPDYRT